MTVFQYKDSEPYNSMFYLSLYESHQNDSHHIDLSNYQSLKEEGVIAQKPTPQLVKKQTEEQR